MYIGTNPIVQFMVDIRDHGLEYVSRRYYSLYGGEVVECSNGQGQARSSVKVGILGNGRTTASGEFQPSTIGRKALPASIYAGQDHGIFFPPECGDAVWVSFDHGDPDHPRIHGSWWRNTDEGLNQKGSEVPSEFRLDDAGNPVTGEPTRRGIKTKFGHGMIFSDEESAPYVAIWSGKQTGPSINAVRKQQIVLSDTTGKAKRPGSGEPVETGIYANTIKGLRVELNDTKNTVLVSGKSDPTGAIANSIKIDDLLNSIVTKTKGQQFIGISDATNSIDIQATAKITETAPLLTQNVLGVLTQNAITMCQVIATTFVQSALSITQTAITSITLTAPTISLLGGAVVIGPTPKPLMNSELITWLQDHTHPVPLGPGVSGKPASGPALGTPTAPTAPYATTSLKGT